MLIVAVLKLKGCGHNAAKLACERWHYSGCLPSGRLVRIGVYEDDRFIGVVLFGRGATPRIGSPFGLDQRQVCELVRVALTDHQAPVSKILALAIRLLRKSSPGLKLIVSYADPGQGHHGGIYQAANWLYLGTTAPHRQKMIHGKAFHKRSVNSVIGPNTLPYGPLEIKHKYVLPLDSTLRKKLGEVGKPYPRAADVIEA